MAHVDAQLLKWATDSQKFSYQIKGALYVSDLSGNSRLVYQAPSGQYQLRGSDNSYVGGAELHGPIGQTWWIAADQMVIERYLGDLPSFTTKTGDDLGLQPNTTTIAYVAGTPKLVDLKKKWIIRGVCPGQSLVLIGENYRQGQLYLASASELLQANYRPLPGDVNTGGPVYGEDVTRYDYRGGASQNVRFIPGNCKLVYLKDQGENSANTAIVFIDPKTLQESAGPTLDVHQIPEVVFARNTALAVAIHNESPTKGGTLYAMSLVDMNSGQHERLNTMGNLDALNLRLLGWID